MKKTVISLTIAFLAAPALAQSDGTFVLTSSNAVSPTTPTTTIEIWATWVDPGGRFYFAGGNYDLTAGDGVFSNPVNVLIGPGSSTGVIAGNVVSGAINGQLHLGPLGMPLRDNPILIATYDWTTTDFSRRSVTLTTSNTTVFGVGHFEAGPGGVPPAGTFVSLFPAQFTPGSGVIIIEPASQCYADCDRSGTLDLFDFLCFQNSFVNGEPYACDCDTSTGPGVCDIFDFLCFQNAYVGGCP